MTLPHIRICGLQNLRVTVDRFQPDMIISISDKQHDDEDLLRHAFDGSDAYIARFHFHDIERVTEGFTSPTIRDGEELIDHLSELYKSPQRILAHCSLGVSRSPAMMMTALSHLSSKEPDELIEQAESIFQMTLEASPHMRPNKRIMKINERLNGDLGRILSGISSGYLRSMDAAPQTDFTW